MLYSTLVKIFTEAFLNVLTKTNPNRLFEVLAEGYVFFVRKEDIDVRPEGLIITNTLIPYTEVKYIAVQEGLGYTPIKNKFKIRTEAVFHKEIANHALLVLRAFEELHPVGYTGLPLSILFRDSITHVTFRSDRFIVTPEGYLARPDSEFKFLPSDINGVDFCHYKTYLWQENKVAIDLEQPSEANGLDEKVAVEISFNKACKNFTPKE